MSSDPADSLSDEHFPKQEHVLKTKDFRVVYKKGLSVKSGPFVLYCMANGLGHNRIGFSISSRNIKLSTVRNRIRRLFREVYRRSRPALKQGSDIVIIIRRGLPEQTSYKEAEAIFLKLTTRAGIGA